MSPDYCISRAMSGGEEIRALAEAGAQRLRRGRQIAPLFAALLACAHAPPPQADLDLHRRALVIDTHSDVTQEILYKKADLAKRRPSGHEDIPRMQEGG